MLYGRFTFCSELTGEAILPPFKGSTFRGAFGTALKMVVCALKKRECTSCLLSKRCVYAMFFEDKSENTLEGKGSATPPHPFIIEPPHTSQILFKSGDGFNFNLLLFGRAVESLPYCIFAFEQMGQIGIGKRIHGERAGFVLKTVSSSSFASPVSLQETIIYSIQYRRLIKGDFTSELVMSEPPPFPVERITIHLKTPLRVKHENRLKADLPFHILIRAAQRRVSDLFRHFGEGEPPLDYKGSVRRAMEVEIETSNLRWLDWERYSNRQEVTMFMGGLIGSATYKGKLTEFIPLLRLCEEVHVGKQTTFGLCQIAIEINSN